MKHQLRYNYFFILKDAECTLNQRTLYGAMDPIGRIHESRNIVVDTGVALPTLTSKDSLGEFVLLIRMILGFAELRVNCLQIDRY